MANGEVDKISGIMSNMNFGPENDTGVSFQGKGIKLDKAEDCNEIIQAIEKCEKLNFLNLEGNTLGVEAAKAIAKALESKPELKRALLKDIFTSRMKEEIPMALLHLGNGLALAGARLTELDMSDNAFGPIGVEGLAGLLRSSTCYQLKQLKLNNNGLGISGGKMVSEALLQCYANSVKEKTPLALKVFIAGRNRLENEGAAAMAEVFQALGSLEVIALPQNGIYHPGIEALSKSFRANPNLKTIDLDDNMVTRKGAIFIAHSLYFLPKLRVLNLGDCLLGTKGAKIIAKALARKNMDLEELHLAFNEINISGGLAIAKSMKNKKNLKLLNLNGNRFNTEGLMSLKNMLKDYGKISCLASLSEDEGDENDDGDDNDDDDDDGDDDDDDDYDDGDEDDEDEDEGDDESENEDAGIDSESDKSLEISQTSIVSQKSVSSPQSQSNERDIVSNCLKNLSLGVEDEGPVSKFLLNPTMSNFKGINKKLVADYIQAKRNSTAEFYLETLIPALMKISSISCCSKEELRTLSLDISFDLYKELFNWAIEKNQIPAVNNVLIVYLGLIKAEDKNFKINWNKLGCLSTLQSAISKGLVPLAARSVLNCFLKKDEKK